METLDPNDMEILDENDFEVVPPTPLPERIVSNIAKATENVASPIMSTVTAANPTSNKIIENILDTSKGVAQGMTLGSSDELGGGLGAITEYLYNKFNPTDSSLREQGFQIEEPGIVDLYRKNQKEVQKEFQTAEDRSPWLYTGGQLGGGLASGSAVGGMFGIGGEAAAGAPKLMDIARNEGKLKALGELGLRGLKTYGQALPIIATESALSSKEGGLTSPEEREKLLEDTVGGALFGLPTVLGLQAVTEVAAPAARSAAQSMKGKMQGVVEDTPLLRQMKVAYNYGTEGINPKSQSATLSTEMGKPGITELDNVRTMNLLNEIQSADEKISKAVGQSLTDATNAGKVINVDQPTRDALSQVSSLAAKYPEIVDNTRAKDIFGKIASTNGEITPLEARDLIDYMDAYIGKFKSATNKTPLEEGILSNLFQTRKQFSNTLQTQVPEYGAAAQRMASFRNKVPETIIAGTRPVEVKDQYYGSMKDQDQKLFDPLKKLIQGTTKEGTGTAPVRESFVQSMKGMKSFEAEEADRIAQGVISDSAFSRPVSAIEQEIKKFSDDAVARGTMDALHPNTGIPGTMAKAVTGMSDTGRSMALSTANLAGRLQAPASSATTRNPIAKMSRAIYNAPNETVSALARGLKTQPGLEKYGNQLEHALQSTDTNRRNQVLFTIMQNPSARLFVEDQAYEQQE